MMYAKFKEECERLEAKGYKIEDRNNHACTAIAVKGQRKLLVGVKK